MSIRTKRVAGVVSAIAVLALSGGVAAQFTTSTSSAPQSIGTGTVGLALDNVSDVVWTQDITNLAAGDSVERFVDLRNSGSLKLSSLTASQTNTLGDLLAAPSDVSVTLSACSVAWNYITGTCSTGAVSVLSSTSVREWAGTSQPLKTFEDFGAGEIRHLKVSTKLSASATNAVQAKTGAITYTFGATQRAAGTYGQTSNATTTLPATIPAPTTSVVSATSVTQNFSDLTGGRASYSVSWGPTGNSSVAPQSQNLAKGSNSYALTGLTAGVTYDVTLTATLGVQKTSTTTQVTPKSSVVPSSVMSGFRVPEGTVASSPSSLVGREPEKTIDNDGVSYWASGSSAGTISYAFPAAQSLTSIGITEASIPASTRQVVVYGQSTKGGSWAQIGSASYSVKNDTMTWTKVSVTPGDYFGLRVNQTSSASPARLHEITLNAS